MAGYHVNELHQPYFAGCQRRQLGGGMAAAAVAVAAVEDNYWRKADVELSRCRHRRSRRAAATAVPPLR